MFSSFYAHIRPKHVWKLLHPYTHTCLHTSTLIYSLYTFTYFEVHTPTHDYILLRSYTPYNYVDTYTRINALHTFTYLYAYIRPIHVYIPYDHIHIIHDYILLCPYTPCTCLHTSWFTYLYKFTYVHAHIRIHIFIYIRPYSHIWLYISTAIYLFQFSHIIHTTKFHS